MRVLFLDDRRELSLADRPRPAIPGECLVRVTHAGICGTDLELLQGYAGFTGVPGHEFVGVVEEVPLADDRGWIGKRVAGEINVGCGACAWCRAGVKEHCPTRTVAGIRQRDGAFAEYMSLPAANLHEIPSAVDDLAAVFVEPIAAACRILEQVDLSSSRRIAVVGDGRLGLLIAQVLRTTGADVTVFGKHDHKLAVARRLGLAAANAAEAPAFNRRFDVVVDATGRAEGLSDALALVRPRGVIVLKSTFHGDAALPRWPAVVDEVTLVGSRCGPFARAIDLLARRAIEVAPIISGVFDLEQYRAAFDTARHGLKSILRIS